MTTPQIGDPDYSVTQQLNLGTVLPINITTQPNSGKVQVTGIGLLGLPGPSFLHRDGSGWSYDNQDDFFNHYNNRLNTLGKPPLSRDEFTKQVFTKLHKEIDAAAAVSINNCANYPSTAMCHAQRTRHFNNKVPGATHPDTGVTVNPDGTIPVAAIIATPPANPNPGAAPSTPGDTPGDNSGDDTINTANYNNTYHPTNIMDAGGTASTRPGNKDKPLKYPLKHLSAYDFIKIYPMEYQPAFDTAGGYDSSSISNVTGRYGSHRVGSMVYLPMIPAGETSSTGWGEDRMNAIQKEFGKAASNAIEDAWGKKDGSKNFVDWAKNFGGSLFGAANNLTGNGVRQFITAYFAGKAVGANILGRSGVAINPNLELLFSGPSLRSFSYNFRFTPREKDEAKEIRDIIKVFKKGMAPRRTDGNIFLNVPYVWQLEYIRGDRGSTAGSGTQHPYLNKIKPCALKSFNVNYMPDGSYMTYADGGSMTSYQVSMEFGELEPIYNQDINMASNDMGY